jgi:hypothetical protein
MIPYLFGRSGALNARFCAGLLAFGAFVLSASDAAAQGGKSNSELTTWPRPSFVKFQTTVQGSALLLTWSVDQAHDAEYFDVLLNSGGGDFSPIGRVAAKGTTTTYGFRVPSPQKTTGKSYYQIRLTTQKDSAIYSPVRTFTSSGGRPAKPMQSQALSSNTQ